MTFQTVSKEAQTVEYVARLAKCDQIFRQARALRVEAEGVVGKFLKDLPKHPGGRPSKTSSTGEQVPASLSELGISRKRSMLCQKIARMMEHVPSLYVRLRDDETMSYKSAFTQLARIDAGDNPQPQAQPEPATLRRVVITVVFTMTDDRWLEFRRHVNKLRPGEARIVEETGEA